jgi:hypothetical protein
MNARQLIAATFAALLIVGAAAPASVAADDEADLTIETTQSPDTGEATVVVTDNGTAVANATLVVKSDDYAGNGTYETDENGSLVLPNPANTTEVGLTAVTDGNATTTEVELVPLSESLDVSVEQADDGTATVTVTQYDAAVENASVVVNDGDDDESAYAGEGTYETDANGTVSLPAPSNDTNVTVTAVAGDLTAETAVDLTAPEPAGFAVSAEETDDGAVVTVIDNESAVENATVEVESEDDYAGNGSYETDANGTVELPAHEGNESVTLEITASAGNDTASTTLTLGEEDEENASQPFGQRVSEFVHDLLGDENRTGGIGQEVSEWVRENNPGKAKGPGDNPGNGGGPPAHAGGNETADGNETKAGNGNNGNGGGPGANPGNGNGNNGNGGGPGNGNGGGPGNGNGGGPGNGNGGGPGNGNGNALIDLPVLPF